jgi:peptidoglycan/LPS O-acetylase OafA/YrhL
MTLITPMAYLALMTWAVIKSNRRWVTLLWIVASLAVSVSLFAGASQIWPDLTEMFGHMALIPSLLVSALVGVNHMQSHPRQSRGKGTV